MRLTTIGWSRRVGTKVLGACQLARANKEREPGNKLHYKQHYITYDDPGIEIEWSNEVRLTGDYLFTLTLSKDDILEMVRIILNKDINDEDLSKLGLKRNDERFSDKLRSMTVGELINVLSGKDEGRSAA